MDASKETWDAEDHPQTRTIYYCGYTESPSTEKVFVSPSWDEALERVSSRTIEAFEKSLETKWDYLARVNSSCYVHKANLVNFCESLPKENVLYGVLSDSHPPYLWGGCQYIMSRDVVENLVANKDKWNHGIMEDSSISVLAQQLGIPLESKGRCASLNLQPDGSYLCLVYNHGENFTFQDFADINKAQPHFFFRVKNDPDRSVDVKMMRLLLEHYQ